MVFKMASSGDCQDSQFWCSSKFGMHLGVSKKRFSKSEITKHAQDLHVPSDTKLLLTKNYSKIIIFGKLRISRAIPGKCLSFLDISRAQNDSKITKNNSQGIIFVIISCQRVVRYSHFWEIFIVRLGTSGRADPA